MELKKASLEYSLKNIPIPNRNAHLRSIINKTEEFLQRVRWKVHFFENPSDKGLKETYGFGTTRNAPQSKSLIDFEHDLTHLISNLEYSDMKTPFQKQLSKDIMEIKKSKDVFVNADKTSNIYKVDKNTYNKIMRDNVTANYVKTDNNTEYDINNKAFYITEELEISDRVEPIAQKNAYITIKDHKDNFPNNLKCRLINPAKSNIGKISQKILKEINDDIINQLELQQWKSTSDALNWFKKLRNKTRMNFIQLDIVNFYPSITEELFNTALDFASGITRISNQNRSILKNARQSILFHNNTTWKKVNGLFDVTMGSFDGCEVCELVGLYILYRIKQKFPEINFGLYRDDGLGTLKRTPKPKLERLKKELFKMFKEEFGLSITLESNLTVVNFLDITLDLHNEKYYPYRKPNDKPIYIHRDSNHPPHVTKQIPKAINKRLNEISSDKESFDVFKKDYEKALNESKLNSSLYYDPPKHDIDSEPKSKMKRKRKRDIIWFTPPYNASLKTNIGKEFLKIIDKNFPKNNNLYKILNRKTLKISYSCTPNMNVIIKAHNTKILSEKKPEESAGCNCRTKSECPVPGECCQDKVVYHATVVEPSGSKAEYIGSTETSFKLRYANHKKSFTHEKYKSETTLSKHIWDKGINPSPVIKWKYLQKCNTYEIGRKSCDLCLSEKYHIIKNLYQPSLINKRTDIGNKCMHKRKMTLSFTQ